MKILLSNDDGYNSEGIGELKKALKTKHDVYVSAPYENMSASSSSLSVKNDIEVNKIKENEYVIHGTPADSVHIALTTLIKEDIDIVISGINKGPNLGDDVIYSGTVAAAIEGRHLKFCPIAISLVGRSYKNFSEAANISLYLLEKILNTNKILGSSIININIPENINKDKVEWEYTRLGKRGLPKSAKLLSAKKNMYNIGSAGNPEDNDIGTDFYAVRNNKISVTPMSLDLTDYKILDDIK